MKNIVKIIILIVKFIILTVGAFVNFFLFIVSTTEIIEKEPTFFFLFLIFETVIIILFFYCSSYNGYTETPPLNLCFFLFMATYYVNLFLLIGMLLYFLTNNGDWITFFSKFSFIFILSDLFQCLTNDKLPRKWSLFLVLIFILIKINDNTEIFLGTFGIYYFFEALNNSDSFTLSKEKDRIISSNIKNLKETIYKFRANVGLFLFSFTLSITLTNVLKEAFLYVQSFNIIPIPKSLAVVIETYPVFFDNFLLSFVTIAVYGIVIILLTKENQEKKSVLNKIKNIH